MKKFLAPVLGILLAVGVFSVAAPVTAQLIDTGADSISNISDATGASISAREMVLRIINFILYFLGIVATAMIIYGGFLYITSGGEDTEKAKKVIMYAAIGIVIVLVSFALVNTLISSGLGSRGTV